MQVEKIPVINHDEILRLLDEPALTASEAHEVLSRSSQGIQPSISEIARMIKIEDNAVWDNIFVRAQEVKKQIYGNRIVIFAPLYISNYCVNTCKYCGYSCRHNIPRRKLSMEEIEQEVRVLESMGHKRIALELGEDPQHAPLDYVLEAIKSIYGTKLERGSIRRINVNIAACEVADYKRLKAAGIGTYILFQETYHRENYAAWHGKSRKGDYDYHLHAFSRAMQAGIDDVGAGVLFGLSPWRYEILGLLQHNQFLERFFGVGFHTISVPRIKAATEVSLQDFPHQIDDETFKKIVAILRIAVPYTGIILSTRESAAFRKEIIRLGVSQISAGSSTGVGGYQGDAASMHTEQFQVEDHRPSLQIIKELILDGYIPSYCTACYRNGRTGDRFMELTKSGKIQRVCQPNAIMTLNEYAVSYGDEDLQKAVDTLSGQEIEKIDSSKMKMHVRDAIQRIKNGENDFFV